MANIPELSDSDLASTLQTAKVPVLVDFSATWCPPCKALAPTIAAVANEYAGKLAVYKVDIDSAPTAAAHFDVRGVPTCIFFKTGKEVARFVGNQDLRSVKERVEKVLAG
jgi:thioredoxin 1